MASPVMVKLTCPLCGSVFRARTLGSNYYISGVESDLRELGSIDEVRRYSVASCQVCRYSDYSWDFLVPEELDDAARRRLEQVLEVDSKAPGRALNRRIPDFERLHLAGECFRARELDSAALAELRLLSYYVSKDLGRRDLEPGLRNETVELFAEALREEDLPSPLKLRYAYLAGELARRGGQRDEALGYFDQALSAGEPDEDAQDNSWDISRMARRMRARVLYRDAPATELFELTSGDDPDVAAEARRLLATQRDSESVEMTRNAWTAGSSRERTEMLRELVKDPSKDLSDVFAEALKSDAPEDVQLGAQALGELGDPASLSLLIGALERGVLSTEYALADAVRRLGAPDGLDEIARVLAAWDERDQDADEDDWHFSSDTTPLRHLLYTAGDTRGLELLVRDMSRLKENDLWDKIPSGGPVSAALTLGKAVAEPLAGLLSHENAAARRWAAYCLAQMNTHAKAIAPLCDDPEQVVRLQAANALAWCGDSSREDVVLKEMAALDPGDLPFALHFLVPFKSPEVKTYLLRLLDGNKATTCEVLPLLGRQEPDEDISEILSMSLLDTNDDSRAGAVTGLAYQGGAQAATRLRLIYDQEDSDEVLRRVIFGLGNLGASGTHRAETIAFLRERLNKANPRLRFAMAMTLLKLDDPSGLDLVRERAALFNESFDRYDLVAPALRALAEYESKQAAS